MEAPGFITLLYIMYAAPKENGLSWEVLPWPNKTMAAMFVCQVLQCMRGCKSTCADINLQTIHYIYRALLCPILNPSMSPMHVSVWASALAFQIINGTCIGGWLAGYGPGTLQEWDALTDYPKFRNSRIELGLMLWAVALVFNMFHDDDLREIRRAAARNQKKRQEAKGEGAAKSVDKVYMIPTNGLFHLILYPHYLAEWIEWCGFWMVGGTACVPARTFVLNEVATMLPRALQGKRWYIERFGKEKIGNRKAIIPGLL